MPVAGAGFDGLQLVEETIFTSPVTKGIVGVILQPDEKGRPKPKPGTFTILVVERQSSHAIELCYLE
jgi:hypothetical protein